MQGKTEGTEKISPRGHGEGCGLHIVYDDTIGKHVCHGCVIPYPVSYQSFNIINHCSDACLQVVFAGITGLLSNYSQSLEKFVYWTKKTYEEFTDILGL